MKGQTEAIHRIANACQILFGEIENDADLKRFGLDERSYKVAQAFFPKNLWSFDNDKPFADCTDEKYKNADDFGVPGSSCTLYFSPDDKVYQDCLEKVKNFFDKLGFNITEVKTEDEKGESHTSGYRFSSEYKHWENCYFLPSDNVSTDIVNRTLKENVLDLTRYPEDFVKEDFVAVEHCLRTFGENHSADLVKNIGLAKEYEHYPTEDKFINVYQLKADILEGYYKGDSFQKDGWEYEWFVEHPTNAFIDTPFQEDKLVISYTDTNKGISSGTTLGVNELMTMDAFDFEHFVNECIFYDHNLNEVELEAEEYDNFDK